MLQIIRSEYGREIKAFEFDYLGGHVSLEGIILNAAVKIFENGLFIGTGLRCSHVYLKWEEIVEIRHLYRKREKLEIEYSKGKILLEKTKQEISSEDFLFLVGEAAPVVSIIRKASERDEEGSDCEIPEERLIAFDEQDKRIEKILTDIDEDDQTEKMKAWSGYLEDNLEFPFKAEISEPQEGGFLKTGNRLEVTGIESFDDVYGIIVSVIYKERKYSLPLCDLEAVDRDYENFTLVDDYSVWFANSFY